MALVYYILRFGGTFLWQDSSLCLRLLDPRGRLTLLDRLLYLGLLDLHAGLDLHGRLLCLGLLDPRAGLGLLGCLLCLRLLRLRADLGLLRRLLHLGILPQFELVAIFPFIASLLENSFLNSLLQSQREVHGSLLLVAYIMDPLDLLQNGSPRASRSKLELLHRLDDHHRILGVRGTGLHRYRLRHTRHRVDTTNVR